MTSSADTQRELDPAPHVADVVADEVAPAPEAVEDSTSAAEQAGSTVTTEDGTVVHEDPERAERRRAAMAHVRKFGDPILREKARPVRVFDDALAAQVERMGRLMHDAYGIGLAATQVGLLNRVLVYRVGADGPITALINPTIEWHSRDEEIAPEGCLSLPRVHVEVERPTFVRVRAQDPTGSERLIEASGLEARVIQHEMDHLDGILILKRTTREERRAALATLREWQDERATGR